MPSNRAITGSNLLRLVSLMCWLMVGYQAAGQPAQTRAGFTAPYWEGNKLKAIFTAITVKPLEGGGLMASNFTMRVVRDGDQTKTDMIVEAPFCTFDNSSFEVRSPGPIRFVTGDTNYQLNGHGFRYGTNGLLYISNKVVTTIQRERPSGAVEPIEVRAKRALFDQNQRQAFYEEEVRVADNDFTMTSGRLTAAFTETTTNKTQLSRLEASQNVVLTGTADGSSATADRALYITEGGQEIIDLSGNPTWRDTERESRARRYVINKTANTLLAEGAAWLKIPSVALAQPGLLFTTNSAVTPTLQTNRLTGFTELSAEKVFVQKAPTNGPIQRIVAETNVVIAVAGKNSRATADRAEFSEAIGDLILAGNARWQIEDTILVGDLLRVNRTSQSVESIGHALMRSRLPAAASGAAQITATNLFIETSADRFTYGGSQAAFTGKAQTRLYEGDLLAGVIDARDIRATFGPARDLQQIEADGSVYAREIAGGSRTNFLTKELRTEKLSARMTPLRTLQSFSADGGVTTDRTDRNTDGSTNRTRLSSKSAIAYFATNNLVERFFARDDVRMTRNADLITGSQAVYFATNGIGVLEVTGQPKAFVQGINLENAEVLIWDQATGKASVRGEFRGSGTATNLPGRKQ